MPDHADRSTRTFQRSFKDNSIRTLVRFAVRLLYRDVDVMAPDVEPVDAPEISVSNHFGGFADPLLLIYSFERRPRIIARDKIWKIPIAGSVMRWLESIPVHKREDGSKTSNDEMFGAAYEALRERCHLLIFPEGITVDDPAIAPIKTGAARIALGARASGVRGIAITPVGIHYENKALLRSRVFVNRGAVVWLDEVIDDIEAVAGPAEPSNQEAVRVVTEAIERRLRQVAPDFVDWRQARALTGAAEIASRGQAEDAATEVRYADRERIAAALARSSETDQAAIIHAVDAYYKTLDGVGLSDRELMAQVGGADMAKYVLQNVGLGLVVAPFAAAGAVVNAVPYLAVKGIGLLPVAPAVKATIKPMGAIFLFGASWGVYTVIAVRRFKGIRTVAAVLLLPVNLAAVIVSLERVRLMGRAWKSFRATRGPADVRGVLLDQRKVVVDEVRATLDAT